MKQRRILSMLLALCLCFSMLPLGALAAPTREIRQADVTLDPGLRSLVDLVLGAAVLRDVNELNEGAQPDQALVEGVLALGIYSLSLPYTGEDIWENKAALTHEEIASMYSLIFTSGQYTPLEKATCPCIELTKTGMKLDVQSLRENPVIGAHVYSAAFDGETVMLQADLYTYYGEMGESPETLPEDALTWLCGAELSLRYAPETEFGYTVNALSLTETYQDGLLSDWNTIENTTYEYSVNLPSIFGLADDEPAHMAWQTADGQASLGIDVEENYDKNFDETLEEFMKAHPDMAVFQQKELSIFTAEGAGRFDLWVVPGEIAWAYHLSMSFPAERQAEFTLYAEFIRNSMIVWELSNG